MDTAGDWRENYPDYLGCINALDGAHGQTISAHIWIDDKPGWYNFADDAPRKTAAQCLAEGD